MALEKYKAKRDFKSTSEPKRKLKLSKDALLTFVVQKHAASHLHYDFRLEAGGVLKSWAVPKGIPKPGEKKLAMMVEDHPLEYGGFEGVIPEGNYGAGIVMLWDRGSYVPKEEGGVLAGIERGSFGFKLRGEKIQGDFSLIKLKKGAANSWLLICKQIEDMDEKTIDLSVLSGKSMEEIGGQAFSVTDHQGAVKGQWSEFVRPMLPSLIEKPFDDSEWLFEIKWDGYRVIASKQKTNANLYSRNHRNFNELFFPILESLTKIKGDFVLDGEVVAVNKEGQSNFQLLQNFLDQHNGILIYYVFDILFLNGYDLKGVPLLERKEILQNFLPKLANVKISQHIQGQGIKLFENAREKQIEGIIGKKISSIYRPGMRSSEWVKVKSVLTQEAVIGGFTQPRGGRKNFGALVLGVWKNSKLQYIGHTGGGFDDKSLEVLHAKLLPLATSSCPFENEPKTNAPVTWVKPQLVCQVKFAEWTSEGIMRQPIFVGLREDKEPQEVTRELPKENKLLEKHKPKIYHVIKEDGVEKIIDNVKLKLTNLNKIYWPESGYSKADVVQYYENMADVMLPHLRDRPQSLHRFPNGIAKPAFFHKDVRDAPDWIQTIDVYSESEDRTLRYLLCQNKATLVYLANLGCIEINVWNSNINNLEQPDYLVLDIDPHEIEFAAAVQVALATKKILDTIGVKGYCKTSGARGLHIYVPLGAKYDYTQVKEFARLINIIVNHALPEITSLERNPDARTQKVYLDYLQNRQGQTMAAPYSLRPRPGAPVSAPLEWKEVNEKLNPLDFNINTMQERVRLKGDLWKSVLADGVDMSKALLRLEKMIKASKI